MLGGVCTGGALWAAVASVLGGWSIHNAHVTSTIDHVGRRLHQVRAPHPGGACRRDVRSRRVAERWGIGCACRAVVHEVAEIGMVPKRRARGVHPKEALGTLHPLAVFPSVGSLTLDADDAQLAVFPQLVAAEAQVLE